LPTLGRTAGLVTIGDNRTSELLEEGGQALVVGSTTRATLMVEF